MYSQHSVSNTFHYVLETQMANSRDSKLSLPLQNMKRGFFVGGGRREDGGIQADLVKN